MKIKKAFSLALALLLSLAALHATPTDPSNPNNPNTPPSDNPPISSDSSTVTLTSEDSNKPVQITTSQTLNLILPAAQDEYNFSDTWLLDVRGIPYAFNAFGSIDGKNVNCVNMAFKTKDPIVFSGSSLGCMYMNANDSNAANQAPDYQPFYFYSFIFQGNVAGTTKLTFSDGADTYTYPITVVASPSSTPAK